MANTVNEMKRIIDAAILRLPRNIRAMNMREFMTEFGGDVKVAVEKEKKMNRCARHVLLSDNGDDGEMPPAASISVRICPSLSALGLRDRSESRERSRKTHSWATARASARPC